jgi:putative transposase
LNKKKSYLESDSNEIALLKQCELLSLNRSSVYYREKSTNRKNGAILLKQISSIYEEMPFYGYRRTYHELINRGYKIGINTVRKLRNHLRLETFYPKPKTTRINKEHKKYPYLLNDLEITRPNQVWATDITYIPMQTGFMYNVSIIDIFSRKILAHRTSNTMDINFCIDALNDALMMYPYPEIFNTDQGSQFTSLKFTNTLLEKGITISMDGKGRALDNVYIERFFRTLKYEDIFLHNYETAAQVKLGINNFIYFYNTKRLHSSLEYKTPDEIYFNILNGGRNDDDNFKLAA